MRCDECFRQHGDEPACQHCGHTPAPPASVNAQLAAVEAARRLLAEARKKKETDGS